MNPHETEELMHNIIKIRDQFKIAVMLSGRILVPRPAESFIKK